MQYTNVVVLLRLRWWITRLWFLNDKSKKVFIHCPIFETEHKNESVTLPFRVLSDWHLVDRLWFVQVLVFHEPVHRIHIGPLAKHGRCRFWMDQRQQSSCSWCFLLYTQEVFALMCGMRSMVVEVVVGQGE